MFQILIIISKHILDYAINTNQNIIASKKIYRIVVWDGKILSKEKVEELNLKIESLNKEIKSLGVDLDNVSNMIAKIEQGQFAEIDFSKYSKHIKPEILKFICPEAKMYLEQILKESWIDIYRCKREAEDCLIEIEWTLEENQKNIEKTLKYKTLNILKKVLRFFN